LDAQDTHKRVIKHTKGILASHEKYSSASNYINKVFKSFVTFMDTVQPGETAKSDKRILYDVGEFTRKKRDDKLKAKQEEMSAQAKFMENHAESLEKLFSKEEEGLVLSPLSDAGEFFGSSFKPKRGEAPEGSEINDVKTYYSVESPAHGNSVEEPEEFSFELDDEDIAAILQD